MVISIAMISEGVYIYDYIYIYYIYVGLSPHLTIDIFIVKSFLWGYHQEVKSLGCCGYYRDAMGRDIVDLTIQITVIMEEYYHGRFKQTIKKKKLL